MLDILRRQAGRFQCPKCGQSLADCQLEMVAHHDDQSLVKVTCAHCQDVRVIAVAIATEAETAPVIDNVRDQPVDELGAPMTCSMRGWRSPASKATSPACCADPCHQVVTIHSPNLPGLCQSRHRRRWT